MADLIFPGSLQCNNPSCIQIINTAFRSINLSKLRSFEEFDFFHSTFPDLSFPRKLASGLWTSIQYILKKQCPNSSDYIVLILNSEINYELIDHFFYDLIEIFTEYFSGSAKISFRFVSVRIHERCLKDKCFMFPCCKETSCIHEDPEIQENIVPSFLSREVAQVYLNTLILSLIQLSKLNEWEKHSSSIIPFIQQAYFDPFLHNSSSKLLFYLGLLTYDKIKNYESISYPYLKMFSQAQLLEVFTEIIADSTNCTNFINIGIEMLKAGFIPSGLGAIKRVIKKGNHFIFACLYIKNYLNKDFEVYIERINYRIFYTGELKKKRTGLFSSENVIEGLALKQESTLENIVLFDLLQKLVKTKKPYLAKFWYGLTKNTILSELVVQDHDIMLFHALINKGAPDNIEDLFLSFPVSFNPGDLGPYLTSAKLYSPYSLFCIFSMLPLYIISNGPNKAVDFINNFLTDLENLSSQGKINFYETEIYPPKARALQIYQCFLALKRVIEFLKNIHNLEANDKTEIIIWYIGNCIYCGENAKSFCANCGKSQFPIVMPRSSCPSNIVYERQILRKLKFYNPRLSIKINLTQALSSAMKYVCLIEDSHTCKNFITNSIYVYSLLMLKAFDFEVMLRELSSNCIIFKKDPNVLCSNINYFSQDESQDSYDLLYKKLFLLNILQNPNNIMTTSQHYLACLIISIWPHPSSKIFALTCKILSLLKEKNNITINDIISLTESKVLHKWIIKCLEIPGFLRFLSKNFPIDLLKFLTKIEPIIIVNYDFKEAFDKMYRICVKEFRKKAYLYSSPVIDEIVWTQQLGRLETLQKIAGELIKNDPNESITIYDLYDDGLQANYDASLMGILRHLGKETNTCEWQIAKMLNSSVVQYPKISMSQGDFDHFIESYRMLTVIYNNPGEISVYNHSSQTQQVVNLSQGAQLKIGWREFFRLSKLTNENLLNDDQFMYNSWLGLAKLCLKFFDFYQQKYYLTYKAISICCFFITRDLNMIQLILLELTTKQYDKSQSLAMLCLAFISRSNSQIYDEIFTKIISNCSSDQKKTLKTCGFMYYEKFIQNRSDLYEPLKNFLIEESEEAIIESLSNAVIMNFPIVQYAAMSIIPYLVRRTKACLKPLSASLSKASSYQTTRDNMNELPFPLGLTIDRCLGMIGAIQVQSIPKSPNKTLDIALENCYNMYVDSESILHSKLLQKKNPKINSSKRLNKEENEILEILNENYNNCEEPIEELPFDRIRSLRNWCIHLLRLNKAKDYYYCIPLIDRNLEFTSYMLELAIKSSSNRRMYYKKYIEDLLNSDTSALNKRLVLKILEECQNNIDEISFDILIKQYIDLQEFPQALKLLELNIRLRFKKANQRYYPNLLTQKEQDLCRIVYQGLRQFKYIEDIPVFLEMKSIDNEDSKSFEEFIRSGDFLSFSKKCGKKYNSMYKSSRWRLGKEIEGEIGASLETSLAFVFSKKGNYRKNAVKIRNYLVSSSFTRTADYEQAYEHILIQHMLENINYIDCKLPFDYIKNRNNSIINKFEYRETSWRVSLLLYKEIKSIKDIVASYQCLIKTAIQHKNYDYCRGLICERLNYDEIADSPLFYYYQLKAQLNCSVDGNNIKHKVKLLLRKVPDNNEINPINGYVPNRNLRAKIVYLWIKIKCLQSSFIYTNLKAKYLKKHADLEFYKKYQHLYIEKYYLFMAQFKDKNLLFNFGSEGYSKGLETAFFYYKAARHGTALFYHSMPRLLSLFYLLCKLMEANTQTNFQEFYVKMIKLAENLPLFVWADRIGQILAFTNCKSKECRNFVLKILIRLMNAHPAQMLWYVCPLLTVKKETGNFPRQVIAKEVLDNYIAKDPYNLSKKVKMITDFLNFLTYLAAFDPKKDDITFQNILKKQSWLDRLPSLGLAMPILDNFNPLEYDPKEFLYKSNLPAFNTSPNIIAEFNNKFDIFETKEHPKKIQFTDMNGKSLYFLIKYETVKDIRREPRAIDVFRYINRLFSKDPDCQRLGLRMVTFCVHYIGDNSIIIEWVNKTNTLREAILSTMMSEEPENYNYFKYPPANTYTNNGFNPQNWKEFQELLRPCFNSYFTKKFNNANEWLKARTLYTRSLAVWSMVGFIIGLGDRHTENILICNDTCELIFIDFECIFNMARTLGQPETVLFRLTPQIQSALGLFLEDSEFIKNCAIVLNCLRSYKQLIISNFESFITDPLISIQLKSSSIYTNPEISASDIDPVNTLKIIQARLDGKIHYKSDCVYYNTLQQAKALIKDASDSENLRKMYRGWAPYL